MTFWSRVTGFSTTVIPDEPEGGYQSGAMALRVLGWLVAATFVLTAVSLLVMTPAMAGEAGADFPWMGAMFVATSIFGLIFGAAFTVGALFWIGFTLEKWAAQDRAAQTHGLLIGIIGIVIWGIGAIGDLMGLVVVGMGPMMGSATVVTNTVGWVLGSLLTIAKLGICIWLVTVVAQPETKADLGVPSS